MDDRKGVRQCDLNEVVGRAIEKLENDIRKSGAVVTRGPLPCLKADPPSMVVVFENLIANAIKFRGPEPPRVHVSARRGVREWVLSVADNGRGLKPEEARSLFDVSMGKGIGLAICGKLVEEQGGRIWAEPRLPLGGASFHIALPD